MCFSSAASFTAAALLIPAGLFTSLTCHRSGRAELLPLALSPALFGLQQGLEGLVWLGLDRGGIEPLTQGAALAYLFFAYGFWLAWLPWCALRYGRGAVGRGHGPGNHGSGDRGTGDGVAQGWLRGFFLFGLAMGLWLWLPLLVEPWRFQPTVLLGNLNYRTVTPLHTVLGLDQGSLLYGLVITLPLVLTGSRRLGAFALALALAFALAWFGYRHALPSSWCFFSAALSLLLLWVVREPAPPLARPQQA
jgi:hypothetical protein